MRESANRIDGQPSTDKGKGRRQTDTPEQGAMPVDGVGQNTVKTDMDDLADDIVPFAVEQAGADLDAALVKQHDRLAIIGNKDIEDRAAHTHGRRWRLDFIS